jgi:hypothetical protein
LGEHNPSWDAAIFLRGNDSNGLLMAKSVNTELNVSELSFVNKDLSYLRCNSSTHTHVGNTSQSSLRGGNSRVLEEVYEVQCPFLSLAH